MWTQLILLFVVAGLISLFTSVLFMYPLKEGMEEINGEDSAHSESSVYNRAETLPGRPE